MAQRPGTASNKVPEIRTGDTVVVLHGKDAGKRGKVERVLRNPSATEKTKAGWRTVSSRPLSIIISGVNIANIKKSRAKRAPMRYFSRSKYSHQPRPRPPSCPWNNLTPLSTSWQLPPTPQRQQGWKSDSLKVITAARAKNSTFKIRRAEKRHRALLDFWSAAAPKKHGGWRLKPEGR